MQGVGGHGWVQHDPLLLYPIKVKVFPTTNLLGYNRGKIYIEYPAQGNPYNTLPPSERRDLWGAGTVYGRALSYPLGTKLLGGPGRQVYWNARRAIASINEPFQERFEPVPWTTSSK